MIAPGVPDGYRTLSPYLIADDAEGLLAFVSSVFGAEARRRMTGEAGGLHAEVELGDSVLMVGEGGDQTFPGMLHVYVEESDAVYERARGRSDVRRGAARRELWRPPLGVSGPLGNQWWVATRVGAGTNG